MESAVLETRTTSTRTAALALGVGGVLQLAGGVLETVDRVVPPDPQYPVRTRAMALTYLALAFGVSTLARRRPAAGTGRARGAGRARAAGLAVAAGGWSVMAVAQIALPSGTLFAERVLFPAGLLLVSAGMLVAAVVMFSRREPAIASRWLPLLCGGFPLVVIFPAFGLLGGPNFSILAAYGACWLGLALAYLTNRPRAHHFGGVG